MVLSLSAKGLTHGEIAAHLAEVYGAEVSKQTISTITDQVMDGMAAWQSRPLETPPRAVDPIDNEEDETDDDSAFADAATGLRPWIASAERRRLVRKLEDLAQFVEGRWRRAIRTGDHAGDIEASRVADGIAARIRHWKPVAAMGGPELQDMRKAFSVAVVNIADEYWRIMAAEVSSRDRLSRRLIRWARRIAAAIVLFGTWAVLTTKPFAWVVTTYETGMAPVLYVLAIAVATTLDPTTHDRVIGAIRQAGDLKGKAD